MIWRLSFGAINTSSPTISHRDRKNIDGKAWRWAWSIDGQQVNCINQP